MAFFPYIDKENQLISLFISCIIDREKCKRLRSLSNIAEGCTTNVEIYDVRGLR